MREYLNEEHKAMFDRFVTAAVTGGCDHAQAESIARERTLKVVMGVSAAIHAHRSQISSNVIREEPPAHYRHEHFAYHEED